MKKIIAAALALTMTLSLSTTALAAGNVDGAGVGPPCLLPLFQGPQMSPPNTTTVPRSLPCTAWISHGRI